MPDIRRVRDLLDRQLHTLGTLDERSLDLAVIPAADAVGVDDLVEDVPRMVLNLEVRIILAEDHAAAIVRSLKSGDEPPAEVFVDCMNTHFAIFTETGPGERRILEGRGLQSDDQ